MEHFVHSRGGTYSGPLGGWVQLKSIPGTHRFVIILYAVMSLPSMKAGLYHVYLLLGKEGELATVERATCECAAG